MKIVWVSILFATSFFLLVKTGTTQFSKRKPIVSTFIAEDDNLLYPVLVNEFYQNNETSLFWFGSKNDKKVFRQQLIISIDTAAYYRLIDKAYHSAKLKLYLDSVITDSATMWKADKVYTDAAIALFKDIYQGYKMTPWVEYDQLSGKYAAADNDYLLQRLLNVTTPDEFRQTIGLLEPVNREYTVLKQELQKQKENKALDTVAFLQVSINYYRWIHHFKFEKFVVVNLAAARLQYFEKDSLVLDMKTVVGKPSTPTPRFATVCDQVILYPYWYVPRSITFNEYLPRIKNNPSWLDANNMQVIDGAGKIIDHHKLNWASFHAGYFPYIIRQSTGCDNALGILKFNITTPYGVYLHDTNNKTAFLSASRYYSHGCMRLEEPLALGNSLLNGKLDTAYLQSCFKEQKPMPVFLEKPVPVFAVYMPATVDIKGKVRYYKDVYKLMKK
jgi:L,D-transpeptidase YcbB